MGGEITIKITPYNSWHYASACLLSALSESRCDDTIVLPSQSRLGRFSYPQCEPTAEWPIDYRCRDCGFVSRFPVESIHLAGVKALDQGPQSKILWCFEFSSDHERSVRLHWLYFKGLPRSISKQELIDHFLIPTGTWKEEYGKPRFEKSYQI